MTNVHTFAQERQLTTRLQSGLALFPQVAQAVAETPITLMASKTKLGSARFTVRAGAVGICDLRLSRMLLVPGLADVLSDTFLHEVAHLIVTPLFAGDVTHGPRWARVMVAMGCAPNATATAEEMAAIVAHCPSAAPTKVAECMRCKQPMWRASARLGASVRSSILQGRRIHRGCGGMLVLV